MEVNRSFECFSDTMACAFEQFVPKLEIRHKNTRPLYNSDLKKLWNLINKENKKSFSCESLPNTFDNVKLIVSELNNKLLDQYNVNLSCDKRKNPKKFWAYVR